VASCFERGVEAEAGPTFLCPRISKHCQGNDSTIHVHGGFGVIIWPGPSHCIVGYVFELQVNYGISMNMNIFLRLSIYYHKF
jgi:hypothetical protein